MNRNKVWSIFVLIVAFAIFALLIDIPQLPGWVPGHQWFSKQKVHLGLDLQGGTQLTYRTDTSNIPYEQKVSAVEGARDIIERRINIFGVTESITQIAKLKDEWNLIVELPGIEDVHSAVNMIGETPILEFKEQAPSRELSESEKDAIAEYNQHAQERAQDILEKVSAVGADFSFLAKEYSEDPGSKSSGGDLGWFSRGTMIPEFEKVVFDDLKVGQITPELVKTNIGYHIIKKTDEKRNDQGEVTEVRASHILIVAKSEEAIKQNGKWQYTGLTGKQLQRALVTFDPQTGEPEVSLEFNKEGAKLFGEITGRNINKPVAIFLDNYPLSIPVVREKIITGRAIISGNFKLSEAKELARRLSAGALPVPIKLIGQQNVGPNLGKNSVKKSVVAGLLGFLLVAIFMIGFYKLRGVLAIVALSIYALIVLALYKLIPVTLTLAGVAGFIVSLGMAVDANILIFERIKDERRLGKPLSVAIDDGFRHAWTAIRDGNITTLIVCFILYQFGSGLVRGFGLTLGIGVIMSMLTAIVVTKTFLRITTKNG
ncbi:protein translocase subunit SecD [Candidatus Parcubacteria bacterium 4484_255]|nr:MAG: protein translocase subunit SecD [Candidatus Parcubacteria bacterium 4484_255]